MDEPVSLFRCKKCGVRMFFRDCAGHYVRCHGGTMEDALANGAAAFEPGPRTQAAKPGANHASPYASHKPKRGRPKPERVGIDVDVVEDDFDAS